MGGELLLKFHDGAKGETRTPNPLPELDPKSSAYTKFRHSRISWWCCNLIVQGIPCFYSGIITMKDMKFFFMYFMLFMVKKQVVLFCAFSSEQHYYFNHRLHRFYVFLICENLWFFNIHVNYNVVLSGLIGLYLFYRWLKPPAIIHNPFGIIKINLIIFNFECDHKTLNTS